MVAFLVALAPAGAPAHPAMHGCGIGRAGVTMSRGSRLPGMPGHCCLGAPCLSLALAGPVTLNTRDPFTPRTPPSPGAFEPPSRAPPGRLEPARAPRAVEHLAGTRPVYATTSRFRL